MAVFIIGIMVGLVVGVGITGFAYNKKITELRKELLEVKVDWLHK